MNSTLGYGLVLGGLLSAAFAAVIGLWSGLTRRESLLPWVRRAVYAFSACMIGSNLVMVGALLQHDFSVKYVAQVGSRSTPVIFTIVSLWSSLEGSILFWGAILGAYLFAFAFTYRKEQGRFVQLSLAVMAAVAVFFTFLIAGPANPWHQIPNPLPDGPGPNPLLQNHWLMIIHPPMLYLGFVGMTVPFGIAAGALLRGELTQAWTAPLRKWSLVPFLFLTIGIILGSWWAYAVLGWGGYWAWDPVENASLLPWLAVVAFLHSTMVLERKGNLKLWTLALGLGSFVLTIIGTFMTRSGVFNSVHSFTQSDIGPTFLVFIGILSVFSVGLLAARGSLLTSESAIESALSREASLWVNNLIFSGLLFVVFIGTVFPLVTESLQNKRISVGEPYFNTMGLPFMVLLLFLMGVGPMLPWGASDRRIIMRQLLLPGLGALAALVFSVAINWPQTRSWALAIIYGPGSQAIADTVGRVRSANWSAWDGVVLFFKAGYSWALATYFFAGFTTVVTLRELLLPAQQRMVDAKEGAVTALFRSASRARRRFGGYVVHLGIVAVAVAVAASSASKVAKSGTLKLGDSLEVAGHKVRFDGLASGKEPHRDWVSANVTIVYPSGKESAHHGKDAPRMNFYERQTDPVGSPAVDSEPFKDVYVSLQAFDTKANTATFNTWMFPLVGWIWYPIPIFLLGVVIALWPQGRRREEPVTAAVPAGST